MNFMQNKLYQLEDVINNTNQTIQERSQEDSKTIEIRDEKHKKVLPVRELNLAEAELQMIKSEFKDQIEQRDNLLISKQMEIDDLKNGTQILYEKVECAETEETKRIQDKCEKLNEDLMLSQ